jgi:calcineurin-like phosphoesterase family protein
MTKAFFSSDLHFHHKRICEFTDRKVFTSQENHTEWLIDIWNSQVNKGDLVWHLGDFSFAKEASEIADVLDRLNGVKHFIKGNHDYSDNLKALKSMNKLCWIGDYREIKIQGNSTVLFHFPVAVWHKQHCGSFHLHGHSHGNYNISEGKILDVGIDSAYNILGEHRLFTEEDVLEYMHCRKVQILDHHVER